VSYGDREKDRQRYTKTKIGKESIKAKRGKEKGRR
jgi:hypothetical protein